MLSAFVDGGAPRTVVEDAGPRAPARYDQGWRGRRLGSTGRLMWSLTARCFHGTVPPISPPAALRAAVRPAIVVVASLALGFVTFHAQGWLPEPLAPLANSSSGWTLLTALLLAWARPATWPAAALGAASFVLLVLGYSVAADLAGLYYDPAFFGVVGLVAGPVVGVAATWLRTVGLRAALGAAVLSGAGLAEATYGLTEVAETTGVTYWIGVGVVALALLGWVVALRTESVRDRLVALGGAIGVAGTLVLAASVVLTG